MLRFPSPDVYVAARASLLIGVLLAGGLLVTALLPGQASAQFLPEGTSPRRSSDEGSRGIETALVARGGFDFQFQSLVLGGLARATFDLPLKPTVQATGDLTFFDGLTDRGGGFDALVEVVPGISIGGGPYWRNTVFVQEPLADPEPGTDRRQTRLGWSAVLQLGGIGGVGNRVTGLEFRWVELDDYNPQMLTLQFGLRLTGGGRRGR